jgi:hypothetical protein
MARHAGLVDGALSRESIFIFVMAIQQRQRSKPGRRGKGERTQATIRFPTPLYSDLKLGAGEAGWPEFSDYVVALCAAARAADVKPVRTGSPQPSATPASASGFTEIPARPVS